MVSIIILSYNTKQLLVHCLGSIEKHLKGLEYEVIVVDNASSDGSVREIREHYKKVHVIENNDNVGFAKGVNQAVTRAKGDYILLVNSDIEFSDNSLIDMVSYAKREADVAVVGGYLKNADNSTSKSFGKFYTLKGVAEMLFAEGEVQPAHSEPKIVDWVSGGYMLIKKSIFEKLHGFDEHFFMYLEDMELCYRVNKLGKKVVYYPKSVVTHIGQGSSNRTFAIVHIYKGLLYFYKKHKSYSEYVILRLMLIVKSLCALGIGIVSLNKYLVRTYGQALKVAI
jgi:GT2 family glycosyltransferase